MARPPHRHTALRRVAVCLVLALAAVGARPSPTSSGPRPPLKLGEGLADPWDAPGAYADARFSTLDARAPDGRTGNWVLSADRLPLRVVIEQEVADRFGFEAVRDALTVWNTVPGSRFAIEVDGIVDTGAERKRRDGLSRVFLDRADCSGNYLARAHLFNGQFVEREGTLTNYFWEADIGICARMSAARLAPVLRHEVAHVAGLGHLCNPGDDCHLTGTGEDNTCRVMFPAAHRCQEPSVGDHLGLIHLYPTMPRIGTTTPQSGPAAASQLAFPRHRSVDQAVLVDESEDPRLQVEAAHLAALREVPLLVVGDSCTEGAGGEELNRVLAVQADVLLVGDVSDRCAKEMEFGWDLGVERLPDHVAVTAAVREALPEPEVAYVVAATEAGLPDAVTALPAALHQRALLLRADAGGLSEHAQEVLADTPSVRRIVIVGGAEVTNRQVETDAVDLHLPSTRVDAGDRAMTTLALWLDPGVFGQPPHQVLLTSTDTEALLTAAVLAGSLRWPVLLTPATSLDGRTAASLASSASGGLVVGSEHNLSREVQVRASRAVDS